MLRALSQRRKRMLDGKIVEHVLLDRDHLRIRRGLRFEQWTELRLSTCSSQIDDLILSASIITSERSIPAVTPAVV
ncbi:hypothetical protein OKW29_004091 [Paraburkholderia sp. CI3]